MPANIEEKIKHQSHTYMAVSTQKTSAFNVTLEESPMRTSGNLIYKVTSCPNLPRFLPDPGKLFSLRQIEMVGYLLTWSQ